MKKIILSALLTLTALLLGQKAQADSPISYLGQNYTLFDSEGYYTATAGSNGSGVYSYENLVDNVIVPDYYGLPYKYTYWMTEDDYGFTTKFIEFHSAAPIVVKGYRLRTACNTKDYPNRRPKSWVLKGKKHEDDAEWTLLATEANVQLPGDAKEQSANFWLTDNTLPYQYFRFEVTAIQDPETIHVNDISYDCWRMELSELQIIGNSYSANTDLDYATIEDLQHFYAHTGSDITPAFTVKDMSGNTLTENTNYTVSYLPGTPNAVGNYTVTITGKSPYFGQKTACFKVGNTLSGAGTSGDPYIIADANDWYVFSNYIKKVENAEYFNTKCYKLANDFDNSNQPITEMIATDENYPFRGTLDGNGRTLHIALTASTEAGCAPFRYLKGATIQNLTVAGTAATSSKFGASIAVDNLDDENTTYITDCYSYVTISSSVTGDGTNGGFVAVNHGRLTFIRCAFLGRMLGSTANSNGGFVGWNDDSSKNLSFTQCVFDPARVTMSGEWSKPFSRYGTKAPTIGPNCYYTYADWGTDQGTRANQVTAHRTAVFGVVKYVTTFYNSTLDFRLPAGALAYTVKKNGASMEFYRIGPESNVIPKGTAVVIIADKTSNDPTMDISLTRLDYTSVTVEAVKNDLKGSDTDVDNTANDKYVLGISGGVLGFYKYSGILIPAGKAYME